MVSAFWHSVVGERRKPEEEPKKTSLSRTARARRLPQWERQGIGSRQRNQNPRGLSCRPGGTTSLVILLVILRLGICCLGLQSTAKRNSFTIKPTITGLLEAATTCIPLQFRQNRTNNPRARKGCGSSSLPPGTMVK